MRSSLRQLRVERGRQQRTLSDEHGLAVDGREHVHACARAFDDRRADEHRVERAVVDPVDVEIALEAVDLAAERIAADVDVDHAEAALVVSTIEHVRREEDHARAGAERGQAVRQPLGDRLTKPGRVEQQRHRRRLPAGQHERVDAVEIGRDSDLSRVSPEGAQDPGVRGERTLECEDADLHLEASDASPHECRGEHCARARLARQAGAMTEMCWRTEHRPLPRRRTGT